MDNVAAHRLDQVASDGLEGIIAQNFDGAVVDFQRVVKREFVRGEMELLTAPTCFAHVFGKLDQLLDDLGRFDGAVLVAANRLFEEIREGTGLNQVAARACLHLVVEQLA